MFEKLLSLLLHAKGGAVATVFVLGTTGALVTATVDNGLTTITITQPSATTTGSETTTPGGSTTTNTTVTETILALFNRTSHEEDPTGTATGKGCSDEAHERNLEMKRVNGHAETVRDAVSELGEDAPRTSVARKLVHDADKEIKDLRRLAVKAIHETFDCDKDDDEDEDEDEDEDQDEDEDDSDTTDPVFTGDDPKVIADLAIALMDEVVANLEVALEDLEEPTTTVNTRQSNGKSEKDKHDNKGKGHGRDRDDDEDDEEDDD